MSEPYHSIEQKAESALYAIVNGLTDDQKNGATVYKGVSASDMALPAIICYCEDARLDSIQFGNYFCTMRARVETNASDETAADHQARVACVRDLLFFSTTKDSLNAAGVTDFTVIGISSAGKVTTDESGDHWVSEIEMTWLCAPSTLS